MPSLRYHGISILCRGLPYLEVPAPSRTNKRSGSRLVAASQQAPVREREGNYSTWHAGTATYNLRPRAACRVHPPSLTVSTWPLDIDMAHWGYGSTNGPSSWSHHYPAARGERQSPINIATGKAKYDTKLVEKPLKIDYHPEECMCLENNGHTFKANCKEKSTLTGGPLGDDEYRLIQFHLHWGGKDDRGAEHTIDGKVYAAELHLVHWNTSKYKTFEEAVDKQDGLAVLCMFIKVGNSHPGFELLCKDFDRIKCKGKSCSIDEHFSPAVLLPNDTSRYWTYPGSLTTPPCFESVTFILFQETLEFSPEQLAALRSLKFGDESSDDMVDNFRPCCYIGTRTVRASFR
ncbi:carbonic anhydrase 2-like isoform X2 [Pomacea canaliculata]|uniref:carbonic anhydrase 2-like isoform X2 n=1 Tax=Pomacea canaliculata TaxID=400727 RepID=UPI000D73BCDC|nr:carbonic anhydrase 2-like isoform X2 [Pomacea canaliculata]